MDIFKKRLMTWWETGLIKWATLLIGIAIGSYWSLVFLPYVSLIAAVGVLLGIIAAIFWSQE